MPPHPRERRSTDGPSRARRIEFAQPVAPSSRAHRAGAPQPIPTCRPPRGEREPLDHIARHVTSDTAVLSRLAAGRSEEHTSELQSPNHIVFPLLLEKKKNN